MAFTSLCTVLSPPALAAESGSPTAWPAVEEKLGTELPSDYKEYINAFGTGQIGTFLWPYNPFSTNKSLNLLKQVPNQLGMLRQFKDEFGDEDCPYPLFPESGGLLPWGVNDNGGVLFWVTTGPPDDWLVAVNEARGPRFEQYGESMTSFLKKLLLGEITSKFYRGFPKENAVFVPYKPSEE